MLAPPNEFIEIVAVERDLVVTATGGNVFRVEPRRSARAWHCDLDDGTPTGENDPASFVRWVCPGLRAAATGADTGGVVLDVRRPGPRSDLGRMAARVGRLFGGSSDGDAEPRFAYADPSGVIDAALRERIEHWPAAPHGDGVVRPAELWSIHVTREGLIVDSVSWWGSAPALDHQLSLAIDIAERLAERQ